MSDEWQPIETAPKDTRCLFWLDWSDDCASLNPPLMESSWAYENPFMGKFRCWGSNYKAVAWQPLPSPPSPSQQGADP